MAAQPTPLVRVVELRHLRSGQLDQLLEDENDAWLREFDWDFRPSAELVRRFLNMQALSGHALLEGNRAVGYVYYVAEDQKGLIGDLFVRDAWRDSANVEALLGAAVESLAATPGVRRIESQLMIIDPAEPLRVPLAGRARHYSRDFFLLPAARIASLAPLPSDLTFESWQGRWGEETAQLIADCYKGHVDGDINDQYRSVAGARKFLHNIVQYPGCGTFFQPASYVVFDRGRKVLGLCLASLVAHDVGHLTQICVAPGVQGKGLGYELMRRSLATLAASGCRKVSLTVTTSNRQAIRLYEAIGFERTKQFRAITWDL